MAYLVNVSSTLEMHVCSALVGWSVLYISVRSSQLTVFFYFLTEFLSTYFINY